VTPVADGFTHLVWAWKCAGCTFVMALASPKTDTEFVPMLPNCPRCRAFSWLGPLQMESSGDEEEQTRRAILSWAAIEGELICHAHRHVKMDPSAMVVPDGM